MSGILGKLFGTSRKPWSTEADPLVDRIVKATDKRLAFVKGYRESLGGPAIAARDRLRRSIGRIPGPTQVDAKAWSADDTVRALFAHSGDIAGAFSGDEGVRAFFVKHPASDCIAMLGLEKREKRVLAAALQGDSVQAEVARTTVSFAEPRILAPAADEAAVREELVARALEYLAMRALERVGAARLERQELEKERALLTAQLKLAARRGTGFGSIGAPAFDKAELERDLELTVRELEGAASRLLLPMLIEEIVRVLGVAEEYLAIEPCAIALDAMNFRVEAAAPQAVVPRIAILTLAGRGSFAVLVARFPRAELKAPARLADARFI
jgi:hypothetical protein